MNKKICKECKKSKPTNDFYGLQGECKECTKLRVKKRELLLRKNPDYIEKERKRGREKYRRLYVGTGTSNLLANKNYNNKYPEKAIAKNNPKN